MRALLAPAVTPTSVPMASLASATPRDGSGTVEEGDVAAALYLSLIHI